MNANCGIADFAFELNVQSLFWWNRFIIVYLIMSLSANATSSLSTKCIQR